MKRLQDHILPVVRAFETRPGFWGVDFHGTAFFIDDKGTFLTAGHVLRNSYAALEEKHVFVGLIIRHPAENRDVVAAVSSSEPAAAPNDIVVGRVQFAGQELATRGAFVLPAENSKLWMWQDVWTAGYPESAITKVGEAQQLEPRGYHGYITRNIPNGYLLTFPHPEMFEVDFPVVQGMSGAPLVLRGEGTQSFILIGVCRGSHSSEVVDYAEETVENGGAQFTEKRLKVEQYGLADDIRPLLDWTPALLKPRTLAEAIQSSFE